MPRHVRGRSQLGALCAGRSGRLAFGVVVPRGPVKITWAAVGALWAASQACSRLAREMFNTKRRNEPRVTPTPGSPADLGLTFMNLAQQLGDVGRTPRAGADGNAVPRREE